jgi:hypothetical protein
MDVMSVSLMEGCIYCTIVIGSDGMMYLPSFIKIDSGVQAIIMFYLRNLKNCNVGITIGRDI